MIYKSHAAYQRELDARARAWTTGCLTIVGLALAVVVAVCCMWNGIGGVT